jgi:hypothetical protein
MNDVEHFIRKNRNRFDRDTPPDALWNRIEAGLPAPMAGPTALPDTPAETPASAVVRPLYGGAGGSVFGRWPLRGWWLAAAMTGALLVAGLWAANQRYGLTQQPEVVAAAPAYASQFVQYARLIDDKRAELRQITQADPALYRQFAGDLDKLETGYKCLKADLPQNPNQELLIQAMIQNLHLQIDLLNQQLRVIQQMKQQTAIHHEPVL